MILKDHVYRNSDNYFLILAFQVLDGDLRPIQIQKIEMILLNICLHPKRGINLSFCIDKSKFLQFEQTLHSCLIGLQMLRITQIFLCHQFQSRSDDIDLIPQIVGDHLLAAPCQLIQVQKADRADSRFRVCSGAVSCPDCAENKNQDKGNAADECNQCCVVSLIIHGTPPLAFKPVTGTPACAFSDHHRFHSNSDTGSC